jgi:hypothetical protein
MFRPMLRDGEQMVGIYMFDCLIKTNFSISAGTKYHQNFQTFAEVEVAVYERNIYICFISDSQIEHSYSCFK